MAFYRTSETRRLFVAIALGLAGPASSAPPGALEGRAVYVADSSDDRLLRFFDRDRSGLVEPAAPSEVTVFYDDSSPGPDLSTPSALLASAEGEVYLLDGGTLDAILVLADRDGDGTANGEGEWRTFFDDASPAPNLSTPGAMARGAGGAIYIADDGSGAGRILRVEDRDGDGSANGPDEWQVVYDATALSPPVGALKDLEALAVLPDGRLLASESTLSRIYVLQDSGGDGDFLDADEAAVFFDPLGAHPFVQLQGLAVGPAGEVFASDAESGLVVRLEDRNGDGTAMDPGEASFFLDPALPPSLGDVGDLTVDPDGTLVVLDRSRDAVLLVRDLDLDGRAGGAGEAVSWLADQAASLTTPSAVATGPAPPEPPPEQVKISRISPSSGPAAGGTPVRIEGRFPRFETAAVAFAGVPASITSASLEAIACLSPPGAAGPAEVQVSTAAGQAVLAGGFRYQEGRLFLRGDANSDGARDLSDAVAILSFLFLGTPPPPCHDALDADDDGDLNISDPIFLLTFLFQGGSPLPPPGPAPGLDGTSDLLPCEGSAA